MTKQQKIKKYFNQKNKLTLKNRTYLRQVKILTDFFLSEDLAGKGDITTDLLIKKNKKSKAQIIAKENGVLAGIEETKWLLARYRLQVTSYKKDGAKIKKGDVLLKLNGTIKNILKTERTALNILQRMSGIATETNKLVKKIKHKSLLCSTRKTQWGLLDKKAVMLGGGGTHRLGLHDFILVKDNHLAATDKINWQKLSKKFWEIEVDSTKQALVFARYNPDAIMLDNFKPQTIKRTIKKLSPQIIFEASGGITESNLFEYAKTGVDVISMGSLTHSTKSLNINLQVD